MGISQSSPRRLFVSHFASCSSFPKETPELKIQLRFFFRSVANRSQVLTTHAQLFDSNACAAFWVMSTWHSVMADDKKLLRCKISTNTVYNTPKTHTKYAHIIRDRPTLKDDERFRNGSVREPYERSLYERTSWENLSSRNKLYQLSYLMLVERSIDANLIVYVDLIVNQAEYQYEVWTSKKVWKFVYARILSCIPMSSTLYCYVNAKKAIE